MKDKYRHMRRLNRLYKAEPIYLITTCAFQRQNILANEISADILVDEWKAARERHGWIVGRFVIMPDHVHFFARPGPQSRTLSTWIRFWKEWTAKRIIEKCGISSPFWQPEFHDYVFRSYKSYSKKWMYILQNPQRAGLAMSPKDWKWQGEIENLQFEVED